MSELRPDASCLGFQRRPMRKELAKKGAYYPWCESCSALFVISCLTFMTTSGSSIYGCTKAIRRSYLPSFPWCYEHPLSQLPRPALGNPKFGNCCNSGNLNIPLLPNPPVALQRLYDGDDTQSREFKQNLWRYNCAFAFTSLGVAEDHSVNLGCRGPPVFRIQGELFHRSGSLLPDVGRSPTYSQLYIYKLGMHCNTAFRTIAIPDLTHWMSCKIS
jgi:hypothetical protein